MKANKAKHSRAHSTRYSSDCAHSGRGVGRPGCQVGLAKHVAVDEAEDLLAGVVHPENPGSAGEADGLEASQERVDCRVHGPVVR